MKSSLRYEVQASAQWCYAVQILHRANLTVKRRPYDGNGSLTTTQIHLHVPQGPVFKYF